MEDLFADLAVVDIDQPRRMTVLNIDGTPIRYKNEDGSFEEAYIDVYSVDSNVHQKHQDAMSKMRFDAANRGQRYKMTPQTQRVEATDTFVALTAGWNFRKANGEKIPFSSDNARNLYENQSVKFIRDQVDEFAANRTNFVKP